MADILGPDQSLGPDSAVTSLNNGKAILVMQGDGNLVEGVLLAWLSWRLRSLASSSPS